MSLLDKLKTAANKVKDVSSAAAEKAAIVAGEVGSATSKAVKKGVATLNDKVNGPEEKE